MDKNPMFSVYERCSLCTFPEENLKNEFKGAPVNKVPQVVDNSQYPLSRIFPLLNTEIDDFFSIQIISSL